MTDELSEPVYDRRGRLVGAIVQVDGQWFGYRFHTRADPLTVGEAESPEEARALVLAGQYVPPAEPGWLRKRFMR